MDKLRNFLTIVIVLLLGGTVYQKTAEAGTDDDFRRGAIYFPLYFGGPAPVFDPLAQRGPEFRKWLSPSVRIRVRGASGSGTIVYYDREKNLAYVASCGHLWSGTMTAEEGKNRKLTCDIDVFYHNDKKLAKYQSYTGHVLFYSNNRGRDLSLLTFTPDWEPLYFPIAPLDHKIPPGSHQHSTGCDHGDETAHYDVEIVGIKGDDLVTRNNSPRPGRSGGGLLTDDGYYIGICWGTSDRSGNGIGYFTPLSAIHSGYSRNGYAWLLKIPPPSDIARELPIIDRSSPQGMYPKDYIPLPGR